MKRLNKKGFMLMETLIVTTFVLSMFIFVYNMSIPIIGDFERRYNYDDINSVYAANLIRTLLLDDPSYESIISEVKAGSLVIKDISNCNLFSNTDLCNVLKEQTKTTKMYLSRYEISRLKKEIKNKNVLQDNIINNRGVRNYIEALPRFTNSDVLSGYRLIIVRETTETSKKIVKYSNIEVIK